MNFWNHFGEKIVFDYNVVAHFILYARVIVRFRKLVILDRSSTITEKGTTFLDSNYYIKEKNKEFFIHLLFNYRPLHPFGGELWEMSMTT